MLRDQPAEWNRTRVDFPRDYTIADLFRQQVARTPDAIAIVYQDRHLSYRELDQTSSRLASYLQGLGVSAEMLVGLCLERSENLVVSLLGILKAGGAYVPLDPSHPKERLSFVIEDSGLSILLASAQTRSHLPVNLHGASIIDVNELPTIAESAPEKMHAAIASSLAYVMYTSGSTGKPKGVMVEHRNVVNFFWGMDGVIGNVPGVWLAVTSVAFDISVLELLWTLTRGFTVVILGEDRTGTIAEQIALHNVTHLQMTPSLARMLTLDTNAFSTLGRLKKMLLGGETVPASLVHRIRQVFKGELYNMYGPTETTIWSTTYTIQEFGATVPIGQPIANTQIYILTDSLKPVAPGEPGELFIGGDGVARGYLRRPQLTVERFIVVPEISAAPIYRTGDLVRMAAEGNLEFLGRADYQVKLRGHRIELGEIEAALEQRPGVSQAVVVLRDDREGDPRLVAYLVVDETGQAESGMMRSTLQSALPEIMVPSAFVFLPAMPLTENGKIDRKALINLPPPSTVMISASIERESSDVNAMERAVARVWQEALGLPAVGVDENFFDLGAHSLTVAEVQLKLQTALSREVSLVDLFQFTTVRSLAGHLGASRPVSEASPASDRAQRRKLARQR
jgi:amino acid adenylation domain-containing protein